MLARRAMGLLQSAMSRATHQMRQLAARLIALEARPAHSDGAGIHAATMVCEKLRPQLAPLMGATGFHALLSRAITLARMEVPQLCSVHVNAIGTLSCSNEDAAPHLSEELFAGGCAIVAQLLGLLEAFVGERLTLRVLSTVWPKLGLSQ